MVVGIAQCVVVTIGVFALIANTVEDTTVPHVADMAGTSRLELRSAQTNITIIDKDTLDSMKVYIFLRNTEDWASVSVENLTHAGLDEVKPIILGWNDQFHLTWQEYRRQVKEVAQSCMPNIHVIDVFEELMDKKDEDVVVPIDDDDYLHPDIEKFIHCEMKDNDFLQWTQVANLYKPRCITKWNGTNCSSSDHCLRIGHLRKIKNAEISLHGHCNVLSDFRFSRRIYVPEVMSCWNWHVGSISVFRALRREGVGVEGLTPLIQKIETVPDYAEYFEPMIRKVDDISLRLIR